jgi:ElaB/YqjD/DUF883 family membrane-anchored ribosome-binding protein
MVEINRTEHRHKPQAIEQLRAQVKPDEFANVLQGLIGQRGMGLDDEALEIAGTYAHAARIAQSLNSIAVAMPKLLESTVADIKSQQDQRDEAMTQILYQQQDQGQARSTEAAKMIETATKRLIGQSGASRLHQWGFVAIGMSIGLTLGSLVSFFILFPNQLRIARLGDGEILEWLATTDGRLLYQTFKSGNRSVRACVKKAGAQSKGIKNLVCQITLS